MATSVTRKTGRIAVFVFDELQGSKRPVENAKIETLSDANSIDVSFTDAAGHVSIEVPPGEYVVSCEAFGRTQTSTAEFSRHASMKFALIWSLDLGSRRLLRSLTAKRQTAIVIPSRRAGPFG